MLLHSGYVPWPYQLHTSVHEPPELLELDDEDEEDEDEDELLLEELLLEELLDELLELEEVELPVPSHAPRLVHEASLPGVLLVYQLAW